MLFVSFETTHPEKNPFHLLFLDFFVCNFFLKFFCCLKISLEKFIKNVNTEKNKKGREFSKKKRN